MITFSFVMFFVCVAALLVAGWSVEVARMFARRMEKDAKAVPVAAIALTPPPGRAVVILPIKGLEPDTEENIRALLAQDYPDYRLIFTVESDGDPVYPLLQRIAAEAEGPAVDVVVAGIATTRGQKIHNQLAAVARTTAADAYLVFMDADARPAPHWLRTLIRPLAVDEKIGATTGFRFYIPAPSIPGNALPSAMASVINAAVAALLGPSWRNIAWGGSMAMRRGDFFDMGVDQAWAEALSDDYVLSWCVKNRARRGISFLHACIVASEADFSWPGFWEFAVRQYKITRVCAPGAWLLALGAAGLYVGVFVYTLAGWIFGMLVHRPDHPLLLLFFLLYVTNLLRGFLLFQGAVAAFPGSRAALVRARFWYTVGYPFSLGVNLVALLRSALGNRITWRGIRYTMHDRLRTTVHRAAVSSPVAAPLDPAPRFP